MAEAFLKELGGGQFEVMSAGIEPGTLNPYVVKAMKEVGIDISDNNPKSISDFLKEEAIVDYVITVCDETSAERCPIFPGQAQKLHWGFLDPSALQGTDEDKMQAIRKIRNDIRTKVSTWIPLVPFGLTFINS